MAEIVIAACSSAISLGLCQDAAQSISPRGPIGRFDAARSSAASRSLASPSLAARRARRAVVLRAHGTTSAAHRRRRAALAFSRSLMSFWRNALPPRTAASSSGARRPSAASHGGAQSAVAAWAAGAAFVVTIWFWHVPAAHDWATEDSRRTRAEHLTVLAAATIFWRVVLTSGQRRISRGAAHSWCRWSVCRALCCRRSSCLPRNRCAGPTSTIRSRIRFSPDFSCASLPPSSIWAARSGRSGALSVASRRCAGKTAGSGICHAVAAWILAWPSLLLVASGVAAYFLKPVRGPAARPFACRGRNARRLPHQAERMRCLPHRPQVRRRFPRRRRAAGNALRHVLSTEHHARQADRNRHLDAPAILRCAQQRRRPYGNLYPVFPYNDFTLMSDQEVVDLYAAVMAAPAGQPSGRHQQSALSVQHPPSRFGLEEPLLLAAPLSAGPARSAAWNRGAYLANGPAHCVACHSPLNALGAVESGRRFTGNPSEGAGGKAPPITALALFADGYALDLSSTCLRPE